MSTVRNDTGYIDFFATQTAPAAARSGSGVLARITCTLTRPGTTTIQLASALLVDHKGNRISVATRDAVVVAKVTVALPLILRHGQ